ncbi:cytochrome c oxidase subunit 6b-3-like [Pyrus ussuriensis x Pyrus communis]|uniref:Cytochrome c oxidase subunit 6b-3-like n=1 Tax=Pyrus ussuriensis x Pyrus communis TaxID=2448454 RepID=A0A5N5HHG6_9ROSA|nr:cytochrome c oxidase subunit 6b-3-like [Pyrus ussuriensis x Pyrus communis]
MSAASQVDPHDKMRARDVNRVARGEQAPRPVEDNPTARHCYASYIQFHKLHIVYQGCERFEKNYKSLCPVEWQKLGVFAGAV